MMSRFFVFLLTGMVCILGTGQVGAQAPYYIEKDGVLSMEAENFSSNNGYQFSNNATIRTPDGVVMDASNFSGRGYMVTNNVGVRMDYRVLFSTTGTYWVNLRSIAHGHLENGFCFKFNDRFVPACPCYKGGGCGVNTAKWSTWSWVSKNQHPDGQHLRGCVRIDVTTPGMHTISILPREPYSWIDKIVLRLQRYCNQDPDCQGCMGRNDPGPPESQRSTDPRDPAPSATTTDPTNVSSSGATLHGTVNPNGSSTTVVFEYGLTTSYGSQVTATQSPLSGSTAQGVSASVNNLPSVTHFHYRVKATNSGGTGTGGNKSFETSCQGETVWLQNMTVGPGQTYDCTATQSATIGNVTVEDQGTLKVTAPVVTSQGELNAKQGSLVEIKEQ